MAVLREKHLTEVQKSKELFAVSEAANTDLQKEVGDISLRKGVAIEIGLGVRGIQGSVPLGEILNVVAMKACREVRFMWSIFARFL